MPPCTGRTAPADPNRVVALKVLDDQPRGSNHTARLRREFEFAHQLDHPHVVTVYDNGVGWLTMEVIGGGTSTALPDKQTRLTALGQIADALDYTHRCGIVHCDVKPTNILVSRDFSRAVLIDFGVAYAVSETVNWHATRVEASLPYAAPELLRGRPPSALTDQYALACTAVELLLGRPPFSGETWMELVDAHLTQPATELFEQDCLGTKNFRLGAAQSVGEDAGQPVRLVHRDDREPQ